MTLTRQVRILLSALLLAGLTLAAAVNVPTAHAASAASEYFPLVPSRIADTRPGSGQPNEGQPLGPGTIRDVRVTDVGGVFAPTGASAVVLNVTVTDVTAPTFLTVYPTGGVAPLASNLNVPAGDTRPNLVTVQVGYPSDRSPEGYVSVLNAAGKANVIVDIEGFWFPTAAIGSSAALANALSHAAYYETRNISVSKPSLYQTLTSQTGTPQPVRVADTRAGQALGPNTTINVFTGPHGHRLPDNATAVVLNVTATDTTAPSFLTVWPHGNAIPEASNLNFGPGQTVPNRVIVPIYGAGDQEVSILNAAGSTNVIVDLDGFFADGPVAGGSNLSFYATVPHRIADSRLLTPPGFGKLGPAGLETVPVPGPANFEAIAGNVTITDASAASFLTVAGGGFATPLASDLNWPAGDTRPNADYASTTASGLNVFNAVGHVNVVIDVDGYFAP